MNTQTVTTLILTVETQTVKQNDFSVSSFSGFKDPGPFYNTEHFSVRIGEKTSTVGLLDVVQSTAIKGHKL